MVRSLFLPQCTGVQVRTQSVAGLQGTSPTAVSCSFSADIMNWIQDCVYACSFSEGRSSLFDCKPFQMVLNNLN